MSLQEDKDKEIQGRSHGVKMRERDEYAAAMRSKGYTISTIIATIAQIAKERGWVPFNTQPAVSLALKKYYMTIDPGLSRQDLEAMHAARIEHISLLQSQYEQLQTEIDSNTEKEPFELADLIDKQTKIIQQLNELKGLVGTGFKNMQFFMENKLTLYETATEDMIEKPKVRSALLEYFKAYVAERFGEERTIIEGDTVAQDIQVKVDLENIKEKNNVEAVNQIVSVDAPLLPVTIDEPEIL